MQMYDIRTLIAGENPFGRRRAVECEGVRIAREWSSRLVLVVNTAATVLCEQCVIKNDVLHSPVAARDIPGVYDLRAATKVDVDRAEAGSTRQLVQASVRRRRNRCSPTCRGQGKRQIANDVADAANFAAGQGAVLGRQEDY